MRKPGGVPEAKFLEHLVAEIFPENRAKKFRRSGQTEISR